MCLLTESRNREAARQGWTKKKVIYEDTDLLTTQRAAKSPFWDRKSIEHHQAWLGSKVRCYLEAYLIEADLSDLQRAVERMHTCKATLAQSVPVRERHGNATVWDGVVHVFDLKGHLMANSAYAWSSPIGGSDKRRFFAVLHQPPVTSPVDAVRAAIVAESKAR